MRMINISIDDISPHPSSSAGVLKQCMRVLEKHSDAKFTLFVPTAYWRTIGPTATSGPLSLDEFPDFCNELKALPKSNFEIAYHGHHHGIPGKSNNDELQSLGYDEALRVIDKMMGVVNKVGLIDVFKPIIRPPAWRMSPGVFETCESYGIKTFALSPDDYAMVTYNGAQSGRRIVYYNCCPPFKPLQLFHKTEIVYHACEWDKNYFSDILTDELIEFLQRFAGLYEFSFIEGLIDG